MSNIQSSEWQVIKAVLTDGSVVWNVVDKSSADHAITIGASSMVGAYVLAENLNRYCAWIDVTPAVVNDEEACA